MALRIWLPLNGSYTNFGLSDLVFSNLSTSNTTSNASGKIGTCYNNNSSTNGGLVSNTTINLGLNQSMFCWVNFTSLTSNSNLGAGLVSQHRYPKNTGMGLTIKYISSTTGYLSVNTGTGTNRTYNEYCGTTLLKASTWYHVGYTYDGSNIKLYVNGVCELVQPFINMSVPADYITVFAWSMTTGQTVHNNYKLQGKLNDVRIYDHCLSQKEIKEISQALVLHATLDDSYMTTTKICYDASGHKYNGTVNGTLNIVAGGPRHSKYANFTGSQTITFGKQIYGMRDALTVNIWCTKAWASNKGTPLSSIQSGGFGWYVNGANYQSHCGTGASKNTYIIQSITVSNLSAGWHMLTITYDGFTMKSYIDAELVATTEKYTTKTPLFFNAKSGLFLGGESNGSLTSTSTARFTGGISDVRIYGTAFSAEDILELYQNTASIDRDSNIFVYEFKEETNEKSFSKTGINKMNEFIEDSNITSITNDSILHINCMYEK